MTIVRHWHGWTTPEHAHEFEQLLLTSIVPGIARRNISGHRSTEVLRREQVDQVEFVVAMTFDDWDAIREFAGGDGQRSVVPDAARALLSRFDHTASHYELLAIRPAIEPRDED